MASSSTLLQVDTAASSAAGSAANEKNCAAMRRLLSRKLSQKVDRVPPHLKEDFLEARRNPCLILHEYCQIKRLRVDYEECDPPDVPGLPVRWAMRTVINGAVLPVGLGRNKKEAKQEAAEKALMCVFEIQTVLPILTNGATAALTTTSNSRNMPPSQLASSCSQSAVNTLCNSNGKNDEDEHDNGFHFSLQSIDVPSSNYHEKVLQFLNSAVEVSSCSTTENVQDRTLFLHDDVTSQCSTTLKQRKTGQQNWDDDDYEERSTTGDETARSLLTFSRNHVCRNKLDLPIYQSLGPANSSVTTTAVLSTSKSVLNSGRQLKPSLHDMMTSLFVNKRQEIMQQLRNHHNLSSDELLSSNWAALVLQKNEKNPGRVIAVASGSGHFDVPNCWPGSYLGTFIHDSHAVVVLRRSLVRFLYIELSRHLQNGCESIFKDRPEENGRWSLRDGVKFHLILNALPCGAAASLATEQMGESDNTESIRSVRSNNIRNPNPLCPIARGDTSSSRSRSDFLREKIATMKARRKSEFDSTDVGNGKNSPSSPGDGFHDRRPQCDDSFQFKIQYSDDCSSSCKSSSTGSAAAKFINFMSCSDKILKCNYLGWQGSLLGCFINPIFISSITFTSNTHPCKLEAVTNVLQQRSFQHLDSDLISQVPPQFKTAPKIKTGHPSNNYLNCVDSINNCLGHAEEQSTSSSSSPSQLLLSLNWTIHDQQVELVSPSDGMVSPLSPFQLKNNPHPPNDMRNIANSRKDSVSSDLHLPRQKQQNYSRLCKRAFLNRFIKHVNITTGTTAQSSSVSSTSERDNHNNKGFYDTYRAAKKNALSAPMHYMRARKAFFQSIASSSEDKAKDSQYSCLGVGAAKNNYSSNAVSDYQQSAKSVWTCSRMKHFAVNF